MTGQPASIADRLARLTPAQHATLVRRLEQSRPESVPNEDRALTRQQPDHGPAPLTAAQRRLWFLDRLTPGHFAYNSPLPLRLSGSIDVDRLQAALDALVARHAVLRTSMFEQDGEPMQRVHPVEPVDLARTDLSTTPSDAREAALARRASEHARMRFDLTKAPLMAAELVRLGPSDHALLLNVHHIVTDGWSVGVLLADLDLLYRGSSLPDLVIQYADLARHEAVWGQREIDPALNWWRHALADLPRTELPADLPRPAQPSFDGGAVAISVSPVHGRLIEALARRHDTSAFVVFLAAFFALLHRYTGERDLAIGSVTANRASRDVEPLIGLFVNTLVLRQTVDPDESFADLIDSVRHGVLCALEHGHVPFDSLVEKLNPVRDPSRNPLVQVALAVQTAFPTEAALGEVRGQIMSADYQATRFDAELHLFPDGRGGWRGALTYARDLFEPANMAALAARFAALLGNAVVCPGAPVASLALIDTAERQQLDLWSDGPPATPYVSLTEHFTAWVTRTPDAPALMLGETVISYRTLAERASAIGRTVTAKTEPEAIVGVLSAPTIDMVAAILGLWASGRAFLPLAPDLPPARLRDLVRDATPSLILSTGPLSTDLDISVPTLELEAAWRDAPDGPPPAPPAADTLAYVIYTSGTTGHPKGVMVEHRGLANLVDAQRDELVPSPGARILQFAAPSFDAFVFELAMALANGGSLALPASGHTADRLDVASRIDRHRITHLTIPPSLLARLDPASHPSLQIVVVAGETCPAGLDDWARTVRLFNAYGPTETTVWSMLERVLPGPGRPTIGRPVRGHRIRIVDPDGAPQPFGVPGEIAIGGIGLARGYLGRPEATAESFRRDGRDGERWYRTGDRGCRDAKGRTLFLGRLDRQLKVRGYRIEPGEIEAILERHAAVGEAAVRSSGSSLLAYVVPRPGAKLAIPALRQHLAGLLPDYMLPDMIHVLPDLPRNRSGKLDRDALPELVVEARGTPPRDAIEARIADIFAKLLGPQNVGRDDNFFDIGGHSLMLLQLQHALMREFVRDMPLAALFARPRVADIAAYLRDDPGHAPHETLVTFRTGGNEAPLFLIHPAIGTSLGYGLLARHLPSAWPVHGVEAPISGEMDIAQLAADNVQLLRRVQPIGPYRVGGWSLGGAIAFEMACQLELAGEGVRLVLIDAGLPWKRGRGRLLDPLILMLGLGREILRSLPRSHADLRDLAALVGVPARVNATAGLREVVRRWPCVRSLSRAWMSYQPGQFRGPALVVRGTADGAPIANDALLATLIGHLSGFVVQSTLRGSHLTLLGHKSVDALAAAIVAGLGQLDRQANTVSAQSHRDAGTGEAIA